MTYDYGATWVIRNDTEAGTGRQPWTSTHSSYDGVNIISVGEDGVIFTTNNSG